MRWSHTGLCDSRIWSYATVEYEAMRLAGIILTLFPWFPLRINSALLPTSYNCMRFPFSNTFRVRFMETVNHFLIVLLLRRLLFCICQIPAYDSLYSTNSCERLIKDESIGRNSSRCICPRHLSFIFCSISIHFYVVKILIGIETDK